jgi:cell division protein ZapA
MEKRKMTVTVAGKPYTLVSTDPPEYVRRVADFVDRKLNETMTVTHLPAGQAAVMTCFNLAEDLLKAQDEAAFARKQMEKMVKEQEAEKAAAVRIALEKAAADRRAKEASEAETVETAAEETEEE